MEKTALRYTVMVTLFIIRGRENKYIRYRETRKRMKAYFLWKIMEARKYSNIF